MRQSDSPFKFLDPFTIEDRETFFGRDMEINALYELAFETSLILVYGPSGAGKTSLIQCGLASRFEDTDWFAVPIRRRTDINESIRNEIAKHALTPVEEDMPLAQAVQSLYLDYFKPIYLIFDQFEELYILGNEAERKTFVEDLRSLLLADFPRKIVIVMREEYIAQLYDFEKAVTQLFDHRLRVEPMNVANVEKVIKGSSEQFQIKLEPEVETISAIIDNISYGKSGVQLSYLQVYLDRLYKEADQSNGHIAFVPELVSQVGDIGKVLGEFLDQQINAIQAALLDAFPEASTQAVRKILSAFVSLEGTKKPWGKGQLHIPSLSKEQLNFCLDRLERARILRLEDDMYELAHDTLAGRIAEDRSAADVAFLEVIKVVKDRFYAYDRTKTLLNNNELQLVNSFKKRLEEEASFNEEEWAFINKSKRAISRRRWLLGIGIFTIFAILLAFSIFSYQQREIALENQRKAETSLQQLEEEQARNAEAKYNEHLAIGKAAMAQNDYQQAIQEFNTALAFKEDGEEAIDLKAECESKFGLRARFDQLISSGDALQNQGSDTYMDALNRYRSALQLGFNNSLAQSKINTITGKLEVAFQDFKSRGDTFFRAEGYDLALDYYRKALRIKPTDRELQQQIKLCEEKLNP